MSNEFNENHVDKFILPDERAKDMDHFVFAEEARKGLRYLPEKALETHLEVYAWEYFDPETLGCYAVPIPEGVMAAYRAALPDMARDPTYRVGWHPTHHRICLFQKQRNRENTTDVWGLAFMFVGEPVKRGLPRDIAMINHDGRYDSFAGQMHEFYAPTDPEDWRTLFAIANNQRVWKKQERARMLERIRAQPREEKRRRLNNLRQGVLDHYRHLFTAAANQRAGSMQGFPIMGTNDRDQYSEKAIQAQFKLTAKDGYRHAERLPARLDNHHAVPPEMRLPSAIERETMRGRMSADLLKKTGHQLPTRAAGLSQAAPITPIRTPEKVR